MENPAIFFFYATFPNSSNVNRNLKSHSYCVSANENWTFDDENSPSSCIVIQDESKSNVKALHPPKYKVQSSSICRITFCRIVCLCHSDILLKMHYILKLFISIFQVYFKSNVTLKLGYVGVNLS